MELNNKHNNLSAKELFEMMENSSSLKTDDLNLGDFEKEALEGFSNYSTIESAKELIADVDTLISEKIDSNNKKNKMVWFSAAASILLIIGVSAFYFKDKNKITNSDIALKNEVTKTENSPNEIINSDQGVFEPKDNGAVTTKTLRNSETELKANKPESRNGFINDKLNNRNDTYNEVSEQQVFTTEKNVSDETIVQTELKQKSKDFESDKDDTKLEFAKVGEGKNDKKALREAPSVDVAYSDKNTGGLKKEVNSSALAKQKASAETLNLNTVETAPVASSGAVANNYYWVNDIAFIKRHIISDVKKQNNAIVLKGKFFVKLVINDDNSIKIKEVKNTSKDCTECISYIEKALINWKNWNADVKNGKAVSTKKEFELEF